MKREPIKRGKYACALFFVLFLLTVTSCTSKKDVIYFQDSEYFASRGMDKTKHQVYIVTNDNLLIRVSALNPTAAEPFNSISQNVTYSGNMEWRGYLVDEKGEINFPVIGKISLAGLTKAAAESLLEEKIAQFISNPVVNIRIMNYKISILGEVNRPGSYTINDEKISLPQALALAGDLTIFGERRNVQIFRMQNGEKKVYTVDLTSPEIFYSPFFYLQQNDLVYIKPNGAKIRSGGLNQNLSLIISSITFLITVLSFAITNSKK